MGFGGAGRGGRRGGVGPFAEEVLHALVSSRSSGCECEGLAASSCWTLSGLFHEGLGWDLARNGGDASRGKELEKVRYSPYNVDRVRRLQALGCFER